MQQNMVLNYSKVSQPSALNWIILFILNSRVFVNQQKYRINTEQPCKSSALNLFQTEWFSQQKEFTTEFESMEVEVEFLG